MLVFMPTPQPESQEEILAAALASLDEHDIPPDEGWTVPDPDSDPRPELSGLTSAELDELYPPTRPPDEFGPAGFPPRDGSGHGSGFADGGALDVLPPGVALAGFADDAHARLGALTDDELIGVLRGWQRQISWSQARKLDAMAELARRRPAAGTAAASPGRFPRNPSEFIPRRDRPRADPDQTRRRRRTEPGHRPGLPARLGRHAGGRTDRPDQGPDHR